MTDKPPPPTDRRPRRRPHRIAAPDGRHAAQTPLDRVLQLTRFAVFNAADPAAGRQRPRAFAAPVTPRTPPCRADSRRGFPGPRVSLVHNEPVTAHTQPQVVAHRGASHDSPEHTLGAYVRALEEGAEALECDVRMTADGHLVCVHDRDLRRTAPHPGVVSTMDLAELDQLDFAVVEEPLGRPRRRGPGAGCRDAQGADPAQAAGDGLRLRPPGRDRDRDQAPHEVRRPGRAPAGRAAARLRLAPSRVARPGDELLLHRDAADAALTPELDRW